MNKVKRPVLLYLQTAVRFRRRVKCRGQTLVEYALIVALIAVVAIAAISLLGKNASTTLNKAATSI